MSIPMIRLARTSMCPEQYEASMNNEQVGYIHVKDGHLLVECPDLGGAMVYDQEIMGTSQLDDIERERELQEATTRIGDWYVMRNLDDD